MTDPIADAYDSIITEPPDAEERAREQEAFSRDVAAYLGSGRVLEAPDDLQNGATHE